jgi:hypothetical protein
MAVRGAFGSVRSLPSGGLMTVVGVVLFALTVGWILFRYYSARRPFPFPGIGHAGAAALLAAEILLFARVELVTLYFTPIAWTAYIAWADSAVFSLRGRSLWQTRRSEFVCLALCSIPLWLIFEAYNLRLANWIYVGLPEHVLARGFGYAWSFATIWPAIFETAAVLRALRQKHSFGGNSRAVPVTTLPDAASGAPPRGWVAPVLILAGAVLLTVPVLVPAQIGAYLFGAVWLGFILFLEPINLQMGNESLWRDGRAGDYSRILALLAAGWVCGIFWEFWNYWAQARWVYVFPIWQEWKIFAMPVPGYLGFSPFAAECFVLFAFFAPLLNRAAGKSAENGDLRWLALDL